MSAKRIKELRELFNVNEPYRHTWIDDIVRELLRNRGAGEEVLLLVERQARRR